MVGDEEVRVMGFKSAFVLALLLLATGMSGCLGGGGDDGLPSEDDPFNVPTWNIADWWLQRMMLKVELHTC